MRNTKQTFLSVLFSLFFLVSIRSSSANDTEPPKRQPKRPNVLVILMDDMGYSDPSFMGGEAPTPNIDRLAKGGLRFTQCYNSARCCPSRASLITGLYPHQAGIGSFANPRPDPVMGPAYLGHLNQQCVTLAEVLESVGFQTYMVGKWHMEEPGPIARGFDQFYGFVHGYEQDQWQPERYVRLPEGQQPEIAVDENFYATDVFTDYSLEFLKQARQQPDQPWLLYLCHSAIHFPVQAPRESVEKFLPIYRKGWDQLREERFERMQQNGLAVDGWKLPPRSIVPVDDNPIANGYSGKQNPAWDELPEDRREDLAHRAAISAAMMEHADQGIGRILNDLEEHQQLDNTLIFFLSDNGACYEWGPFGFDGPSRKGETILHAGEALEKMGGPGSYHSYGSGWANLGNTPLQLYKHYCHEGGNCTPMVVHWPLGIKQPDRWVRQPIHLIDVMPTLCEIAGTQYPMLRDGETVQPTEGTSLVPVFDGGAIPVRPIFSEHQGARSVRLGKWKAVWSKRMPEEIRWELYNIEADRCETTNVAAQYPEVTNQLAALWMQWAKRVKVYPFYLEGENGEEKNRGAKRPLIKNLPIQLRVDLEIGDQILNGVLVAQGGDQHGYSLHLQDNELVFSVRRNRKLTATTPVLLATAGQDSISIQARLEEDGTMIVIANGEEIAKANAGGLIEAEPGDGFSIGRDTRSAVGQYQSPNPFEGKINQVTINGSLMKSE